MAEIKDQLRATRAKLNLTRAQFAEHLKVKPATLQRWEQGTRQPRGLSLRMLQEILAKMEAGPPPEPPRAALK